VRRKSTVHYTSFRHGNLISNWKKKSKETGPVNGTANQREDLGEAGLLHHGPQELILFNRTSA
jgi:hypothetical protein